ncbi:hypothetical protein APHAL10511_007971 [Amanita phalloides]|nr:hypothetical protein APHAL10511_007971 [Amanita phalloides]
MKNDVKRIVPSPTIVTIDDNDILQAGAVVTSVSALIAVLCALLVLFHLRAPLSSTALRFQGFLLAFCAIWLFSALVPFTHFYRTRSAIVSAHIGGVSLPDSTVNKVERALGLTSRYRDIHFLRLAAILPWFAFLFSVITSIMLFVAASRVYDLDASDDAEITKKATDPK